MAGTSRGGTISRKVSDQGYIFTFTHKDKRCHQLLGRRKTAAFMLGNIHRWSIGGQNYRSRLHSTGDWEDGNAAISTTILMWSLFFSHSKIWQDMKENVSYADRVVANTCITAHTKGLQDFLQPCIWHNLRL